MDFDFLTLARKMEHCFAADESSQSSALDLPPRQLT
jgi:hypothetical protein